jgi:hypothetical protein
MSLRQLKDIPVWGHIRGGFDKSPKQKSSHISNNELHIAHCTFVKLM